MANVTLMLQTAPQQFPAGTLADTYRFSLGGGGVVVPLTLSIPYAIAQKQVTFLGVAPGDYQAWAALLSPSGVVLAETPPIPVTVPSTVTLQGPIGVTASVTFA